MTSRMPRLPRRRPAWRRKASAAFRSTVEIAAGVVLGVGAVTVADRATASANMRLLDAVLIIIGVVLAEWGVRAAARRARRGKRGGRRG